MTSQPAAKGLTKHSTAVSAPLSTALPSLRLATMEHLGLLSDLSAVLARTRKYESNLSGEGQAHLNVSYFPGCFQSWTPLYQVYNVAHYSLEHMLLPSANGCPQCNQAVRSLVHKGFSVSSLHVLQNASQAVDISKSNAQLLVEPSSTVAGYLLTGA